MDSIEVDSGAKASAHIGENRLNPNAGIPRQKRLACLICRRRKLKCDGRKPSCSTCARLGHTCGYDEVRKKSGPKRGYVKILEERLRNVENLLETQTQKASAAEAAIAVAGSSDGGNSGSGPSSTALPREPAGTTDFAIGDPSISLPSRPDMESWQFNTESSPRPRSLDDFNMGGQSAVNTNPGESNFTWEIVNLGLDEPLPPPEVTEELTQIYFDKIHPSLPMIHKLRFLAAMNLAPNQRPPVCLRYAMWTLAASITDKYENHKDLFYQRARKYVEADCMQGFGEHMISVAHCQTHIILASYEFKMMYFPRAWMSTGLAVRLCQMIGLHRIDGAGLQVKQCLPPARDWTEEEERRRTFWMAFCEDRYASIGTGWPMTIDERDILTALPSSEENFIMSRPGPSVMLQDIMFPSGVAKLTPYGGIILTAYLFGRNLTHLHRPDPNDNDSDLNGEFWKRHRSLDHILLNAVLNLPKSVRLAEDMQNPNVVFTNMSLHTSIICLHQAAVSKANLNLSDQSVATESKTRCISAATEIARIMRTISHMDISAMNPFICFSLYVSARVFVQFLKSQPEDSEKIDTLKFLLTAMAALRRKNPLTQSFLVQLDLEVAGLSRKIPNLRTMLNLSSQSPTPGGDTSGAAFGRQGATCDEGAGDGILAFQREGASPNTREDITVRDRHSASTSAAASTAGASSGIGVTAGRPGTASTWLSPESNLPMRDRSSAGQSPAFQMSTAYPDPTNGALLGASGEHCMQGFSQTEETHEVHETNDMSTSPGDGMSSRLTPNSSSSSEHRNALGLPQNAQLSAGSSFDASPVPSSHGLATGRRGVVGGVSAVDQGPVNYFPTADSAATGFVTQAGTAAPMNSTEALNNIMSGGPPTADYAMQWAIPGQSAMTPESEGMLRTIIQMGTMETMDLGWASNP